MPSPIILDVEAKSWSLPKNADVQAVVCINMLHIVSWPCAVSFLRNAGAVLNSGGVLYLYGPYKIEGRATSTLTVHSELKTQNGEFVI